MGNAAWSSRSNEISWSYRILRVLGIDIKVHATFLIIIALAIVEGLYHHPNPLAAAAFGVVAVLLLFVCVTLHELGHSVVALRFGVPVHEIILLPIGGVAMLSRGSRTAVHELLIAVAGPAVNVVILAVLVPLAFLVGGVRGPGQLFHLVTDLLHRGVLPTALSPLGMLLVMLIEWNLMLILFNMIPAFPLDGGRVLRALLWMRMPMPRATRLAATIGQVFAVGIAIWGLFLGGGIAMTVIAFFVFIGAGAEAAAAQGGAVLSAMRVGDAYNKIAVTLTLEDRVSRVIEYILTSYQPDFAVVQKGRLLGVVTREDVLRWLGANNYDVFVTEIMHEDVLHVDARQTLDAVREKLTEADRRVAAVFDGETYLGLVSTDDLAEAQLVLTFLQRGPASPAGGGSHRIRPATGTDPVV